MSDKKHYYKPNHLNKEPFLSVWWMDDPTVSQCYIQINEDSNNPIWVSLGSLFELLIKNITNFESTVLKDMLNALRFKELLSADFLKKHIIN